MKKLKIIDSLKCAELSTGGEFKKNKIYPIVDDVLIVSDNESVEIPFTAEKAIELRYYEEDNYSVSRHIIFKDEKDNEEYCIEFYPKYIHLEKTALIIIEE